MLAYGSKEIPDDAVNIIERFVILLLDRTSTCTKVNHAKRKEALSTKTLGATNPAYPSCSRGACQESSLPSDVVTSEGRHCYQTLYCHSQLTGGG